MDSTHARHVARSENSKKFRKVLCFLTWQKAKQLRPANRMRHPRAARVGRRRLSFPPCAFSFGTLLLCAWPHQKPSQMFTSCLPAACVFYALFFLLFCFCFSIIVVLASFITPYFMLVLAFCLLLSFRLWIVVKFFVIINFFFFWRVFRVFVFCFLKAVCAKDCGFRWVWFRRWGKMVKWFRHQHHLALLLLLIKILILVDWFRYMLPTEMQGPKKI